MEHNDLALLLSPLPLSPLLLALAACGSEQERAGRSHRPAPSPFGSEIAMAGAGTANDREAAVPALNREAREMRIPDGNIRQITAPGNVGQPIDDR